MRILWDRNYRPAALCWYAPATHPPNGGLVRWRNRAIANRGKLVLAVTWNNASVVRELLDEGTGGTEGGSTLRGDGGGSGGGGDAPPGAGIEGDDLLVALRHAITVVKDAELATEMVSLLVRHSRMRLEDFAFTLLPLVGGEQVGETYENNLQWTEVLAELVPSAWEFSETLGGADKDDDDNDSDDDDSGRGSGSGPSLSHQPSSSSSAGNSGGDVGFIGPGMLELLLWAVLDGRHRLAETLWQECDEPCRYALLVSQLYKKLSKQAKTSQVYPTHAHTPRLASPRLASPRLASPRLSPTNSPSLSLVPPRQRPLPISPHQDEEAHIEASTKFEAWAVGMLGECPQSAAAALIEGHTARWHMSLLQLALSGHSKHFIAHEQYAALTSP